MSDLPARAGPVIPGGKSSTAAASRVGTGLPGAKPARAGSQWTGAIPVLSSVTVQRETA